MHNAIATAHGSLAHREGAIVVIQAENDIVGFGDIAPLAEFSHETLADALHAFPALVAYIHALSIDEALTFL
jgi:O-succinylbenzoate synthase